MMRHVLVPRMLALSLCAVFPAAAFCAGDYCGELNAVKGNVTVSRTGSDRWFSAVEGMPVAAKDSIRTGPRSSCTLELDDGSLIYIDANTRSTVDYLELTGDRHDSQISLWFGRVINSISKTKKTKMQVKTPTAVMSVRGTEFAVEASENATEVGVFEGAVAVQGAGELSGEEIDLLADQETSVAKDAPPSRPRALQEVMLRNRERMQALRERAAGLKARLQRMPPEERMAARRKALEKYDALRTKIQERNERLKNRRNRQ